MMNSRFRSFKHITLILCTVVLLLGPGVSQGRRGGNPPMIDFTKGGQRDKNRDFNLGPIGARGWMWAWQMQTTDARQILITEVEKGSPADGILLKDDVILGVNGAPFASDARIAFGNVVTETEKTENKGVLNLIRWRKGKTQKVRIAIPALGPYARTAPFNCPKSRKIVQQGCEMIVQKGFRGINLPNNINALALLASGKDDYIPVVREYVKQLNNYTPGGLKCWYYAYSNLLLAEYTLATPDRSMLPEMRRQSLLIARGQSNVGTWGHGFAQENGILGGYGAMNQSSLILTLSMVLARKAGVNEPDVDRAIEKAVRFFRYYVNKGSVPYGDHEPWMHHADNGKTASAAVLFDILGDSEAATFFAKTAVAGYPGRHIGHTGNFFNMFWGPLGASRCGAEGVAAHLKQLMWYFELARRHDGAFDYPGEASSGSNVYDRWDVTGAYVLTYALPLKQIYITGKNAGAAKTLNRAEAASVIDDGGDFTWWTRKRPYVNRSTEKLFAGLTSWSPVVRERSADELGQRDGNFVDRLPPMLGSSDVNTQYGACQALRFQGTKAVKAVPAIRSLLANRDPHLRSLAASALTKIDPTTPATANALLRLVVTEKEPRGMVQRSLAFDLFERGSPTEEVIKASDRKLLYDAIAVWLKNNDGRTRSRASRSYKYLSDEDMRQLLPAIAESGAHTAPSGVMFSAGSRIAGLELMVKYRIREGMQLCIDVIEPDRWGASARDPKVLGLLEKYGGNARPLLGKLQSMHAEREEKYPKGHGKNNITLAIAKAIETIKNDKNPPKLISVREFCGGR